MPLENFGRNVRFDPDHVVTPADDNAVLACLEHYRGHRIRAAGRLHSWSEAPACEDVFLDLRQLNNVALELREDGTGLARIGAGATIDQVLDYLRPRGYTLPIYGIVGKQAIGGAIATATHGSGRSSLSHYVTAVCVAAYDPATGKPRTFDWNDGDELRAARCGLGCTGITLSVTMQVERDYLLEETTGWFDRIEDVVECEADYPRQQFYLVPWSWRWTHSFDVHFSRRRIPPRAPRLGCTAPSAWSALTCC